jgi:uncharacterized protein
MSEILGTGIAFPLGVDETGRLALSSDETDIEQAIRLILGTTPGERPMRPEFGCGIHDFVFERIDSDTLSRIEDSVRSALERWEPRIAVEHISFGGATGAEIDNSGLLTINVDYHVRETNTVRNLVYPFYVIPAEAEA